MDRQLECMASPPAPQYKAQLEKWINELEEEQAKGKGKGKW